MAWDYEKVVRELSDTMTVVVGIQARQASLMKDQSTWLEFLQKNQDDMKARHEAQQKSQDEHEKRMAHIEVTLSEIGDKLNGLIGYLDGQHRPPAN